MNDRCFICGEDNPNVLQEHHIVPRRYGGGDSDDNLITLCANCHEAVEKIYDDDFYARAGYSTPSECDSVSRQRAVEIADRFLAECDDISVGDGVVAKQTLYDRFGEWASDKGNIGLMARNIFGRALMSARDDIAATQRRIDGDATNVYIGVSVSDPVVRDERQTVTG